MEVSVNSEQLYIFLKTYDGECLQLEWQDICALWLVSELWATVCFLLHTDYQPLLLSCVNSACSLSN